MVKIYLGLELGMGKRGFCLRVLFNEAGSAGAIYLQAKINWIGKIVGEGKIIEKIIYGAKWVKNMLPMFQKLFSYLVKRMPTEHFSAEKFKT